MAITYYEGDSASFDDNDGPARFGTLINWAGALVSFGLMAGLAVWGYQLLVRDVAGVPVVRALEGPMRVAPDNPGGLQAENQDLSVTQVAADGAREEPAEQVVLAPPPVELAEEDLPGLAFAPPEKTAPSAAQPVAEPVLSEPAETAQVPEPEPMSAIELAIAEALEATAPPVAEPAAAPQAIKVNRALVSGIGTSPRPMARPIQVENAVATSSAPSGLEVDVATIAPGTRLVQLGAYPSIERARAVWDELDNRFAAYFDGKQRVLQEAVAGGSTFYRLRAMGFQDLSDARRFCAVLVAENANCIPVIRR